MPGVGAAGTSPDALCRGVAQIGSASAWGVEGRWFNSSRPDHSKPQLTGSGGRHGNVKVYKNSDLHIEEPTVWGIGVFDGVHRGHQALFQQVCALAATSNAAPGMLTFEPHPMSVLRRKPVPRLTTLGEKLWLVERLGIRTAWVVEFDSRFSKLTPDSFLEEFLVRRSAARGAVVGFDFTFGRGAKGNVRTYEQWTMKQGIPSAVVPAVKSGDLKIGSSVIRDLIAKGQIQPANELLGRPYFATGEVVHGAGRGKDLGFPTVNLRLPEEKLIPKNGVYVVEAHLAAADPATDSSRFRGLCNIGFRPTFDVAPSSDSRPTLEVYLDGFSGDLYGHSIRVDFHRYLRDERKFDTIDMLREQMGKDVQEMKQYEYSEAG